MSTLAELLWDYWLGVEGVKYVQIARDEHPRAVKFGPGETTALPSLDALRPALTMCVRCRKNGDCQEQRRVMVALSMMGGAAIVTSCSKFQER